jgi:2'-5' RNA ligase
VTGALRPAPETALVLVVALPPPLEALRQRSIADAASGVPAHVTLLYPFAEEAQLDAGVLGLVAAIAARHPVQRLTLGEGRRFPDTLYASVEPDVALRALHDELAAAFPTLPLYGGAFGFTPHVSIVEGPAAAERRPFDDPAWATLPVEQPVDAIDLITDRDGAWATRRRFPLGGALSG